MRRLLFITTIVLAAAGLSGCSGTQRVGEPFGRLPALESENEILGQVVFMQHCHQCHPNGESGLGSPLNPVPAPKFLIATQVRLGLGAMPGFSEERITEDELDAVADYVIALRRAAR